MSIARVGTFGTIYRVSLAGVTPRTDISSYSNTIALSLRAMAFPTRRRAAPWRAAGGGTRNPNPRRAGTNARGWRAASGQNLQRPGLLLKGCSNEGKEPRPQQHHDRGEDGGRPRQASDRGQSGGEQRHVPNRDDVKNAEECRGCLRAGRYDHSQARQGVGDVARRGESVGVPSPFPSAFAASLVSVWKRLPKASPNGVKMNVNFATVCAMPTCCAIRASR